MRLALWVLVGCGRIGFVTYDDAPQDDTELGPAATSCAYAAPPGEVRFVEMTGSDSSGDGSSTSPWATPQGASDLAAPGTTILVGPGVYPRLYIERTVTPAIIVRSAVPYAARIESVDQAVACFGCSGWTVEGFEIVQPEGVQSTPAVLVNAGARAFVLRNNVVHDARENALIRVVDASDVVIARNLAYNSTSQLVHVADATDVTIEDNLILSDFEASGRPLTRPHGPMIWVESATLGASSARIRRNVLLHWQGESDQPFIDLRLTDGATVVENNLLVGDGASPALAALRMQGTIDVIWRHNTIVGDLPSTTFLAFERYAGVTVGNTTLEHNLWSDPTGTMIDFANASPADADGVRLSRNLYWNGGSAVPDEPSDVFRPASDGEPILADPRLPRGIATRPAWQGDRFADDSRSICEAFARVVHAYAAIDRTSPAAGAAGVALIDHDILGRPRAAPASIGAVEPR